MKIAERLGRFFFPSAWAMHDLKQRLSASLQEDFKRAENDNDVVRMTQAVIMMGRVCRV